VSPMTLESRSPWLLGHCSRLLHKLCRCEHGVFGSRTCGYSQTLIFASKSSATVCEAFSNACPDREVLNKTAVHQMVTTFQDTGSVCLWQVLIQRQNIRNYSHTDFKQCISCYSGVQLQELNVAIGCVVLYVKALMWSS
jgi:hypothetical protein